MCKEDGIKSLAGLFCALLCLSVANNALLVKKGRIFPFCAYLYGMSGTIPYRFEWNKEDSKVRLVYWPCDIDLYPWGNPHKRLTNEQKRYCSTAFNILCAISLGYGLYYSTAPNGRALVQNAKLIMEAVENSCKKQGFTIYRN